MYRILSIVLLLTAVGCGGGGGGGGGGAAAAEPAPAPNNITPAQTTEECGVITEPDPTFPCVVNEGDGSANLICS